MVILFREGILSLLIKALINTLTFFNKLFLLPPLTLLLKYLSLHQGTKTAKFDKEEKFLLINNSATNKYSLSY